MKINVLDHGYVEFIEAWGNGSGRAPDRIDDGAMMGYFTSDYERGIIEAARQSTQGSFRGWEAAECDCNYADFDKHYPGSAVHAEDCASKKSPGDKRLLDFLYSHKHFTPFEFSGMVIEVQAPIFVFREWHRHRTQSYNEMSARYAPLSDLYYLPSIERLMIGGGHLTSNKQAQAVSGKVGEMTVDEADDFRKTLASMYERCEYVYQRALTSDIPKELARCVMPVGHYSRMRASANLRNWLAFLTLRNDPAAQWEIRQYAIALEQILYDKFPRTLRLYLDERLRNSANGS